jgi:hypothetical protein
MVPLDDLPVLQSSPRSIDQEFSSSRGPASDNPPSTGKSGHLPDGVYNMHRGGGDKNVKNVEEAVSNQNSEGMASDKSAEEGVFTNRGGKGVSNKSAETLSYRKEGQQLAVSQWGLEMPNALCGKDYTITGNDGDNVFTEKPPDSVIDSEESSQLPLRKSRYLPYIGKVRLARQTLSFLLDLAIEVRNVIYFLLLRPDLNTYAIHGDWRNASGCTKILQLNRQIYYEAHAVLDCYAHTIALLGDGQHLFRNVLAQGKPNMFQMTSIPSACYVPRSYCELQFLRLSKITINVRYTVRTTGFWIDVAAFDLHSIKRIAGLRQEFSDLTTVVSKSKSLGELHFEFQTDEAIYYRDEEGVVHSRAITSNHNTDLIGMLDQVIAVAAQKKFLLTAEEDKDFVKKLPGDDHYTHFRVEDYQDPLVRYINNARTRRDAPASPTVIKGKTIETPDGSYDLVTHPHLPYELLPECRKCYRNFKTDTELREHLAAMPSHRIKFRRHQYNSISPLAEMYPARHKCLVCARGYASRAFRDKHCERVGHVRDNKKQGMVPRFKKDNKWYRCTFWTENKPPAFPTDEDYSRVDDVV